jgi:hypothetical protein
VRYPWKSYENRSLHHGFAQSPCCLDLVLVLGVLCRHNVPQVPYAVRLVEGEQCDGLYSAVSGESPGVPVERTASVYQSDSTRSESSKI